MANNIHIKMEYPEALSLKKDALLLEESLLKIIGNIREYGNLRKREFLFKAKIKKELLELKNMVSAAEAFLPREEVKAMGEKYKSTEIKKQVQKEAKATRYQASLKKTKMTDIEREIENIRDKLARLG